MLLINFIRYNTALSFSYYLIFLEIRSVFCVSDLTCYLIFTLLNSVPFYFNVLYTSILLYFVLYFVLYWFIFVLYKRSLGLTSLTAGLTHAHLACPHLTWPLTLIPKGIYSRHLTSFQHISSAYLPYFILVNMPSILRPCSSCSGRFAKQYFSLGAEDCRLCKMQSYIRKLTTHR